MPLNPAGIRGIEDGGPIKSPGTDGSICAPVVVGHVLAVDDRDPPGILPKNRHWIGTTLCNPIDIRFKDHQGRVGLTQEDIKTGPVGRVRNRGEFEVVVVVPEHKTPVAASFADVVQGGGNLPPSGKVGTSVGRNVWAEDPAISNLAVVIEFTVEIALKDAHVRMGTGGSNTGTCEEGTHRRSRQPAVVRELHAVVAHLPDGPDCATEPLGIGHQRPERIELKRHGHHTAPLMCRHHRYTPS